MENKEYLEKLSPKERAQPTRTCTNGDGSPSKKPEGPDVGYSAELATRGSMERRRQVEPQVGVELPDPTGLHACLTSCLVRGLGGSGPLNRNKAAPRPNIPTFPSHAPLFGDQSDISELFSLECDVLSKLRLSLADCNLAHSCVEIREQS